MCQFLQQEGNRFRETKSNCKNIIDYWKTLEVVSGHNLLGRNHFFPACSTTNNSSWTLSYVVLKKKVKLNSVERSTYILHRQASRSFLVSQLPFFFPQSAKRYLVKSYTLWGCDAPSHNRCSWNTKVSVVKLHWIVNPVCLLYKKCQSF